MDNHNGQASRLAYTLLLALIAPSEFHANSLADEGDRGGGDREARTEVETLSRRSLKLATDAGAFHDRFELDLDLTGAIQDDGSRRTLRLHVERHQDQVSCVVLYPNDVVYGVFHDNTLCFVSKETERLLVSEGGNFKILIPGDRAGFQFSFNHPPDHGEKTSRDSRRPGSRVSLDVGYVCGLFCAPGSDMKWSDDRLEILIAKRSQPDRKARIAINARPEHAEFPVSRVSWDAKDGTTYAITNIHTGKKARLRNHRISLSRLKEQDPELVAGSLGPDQMIQQWLRMMEGGNLTQSQKALGRRLHKMWIDDEAQDGNKSSQ